MKIKFCSRFWHLKSSVWLSYSCLWPMLHRRWKDISWSIFRGKKTIYPQNRLKYISYHSYIYHLNLYQFNVLGAGKNRNKVHRSPLGKYVTNIRYTQCLPSNYPNYKHDIGYCNISANCSRKPFNSKQSISGSVYNSRFRVVLWRYQRNI